MADIKPIRYVRNTGSTVGFSELQTGETIAWNDVNHPTFANVATSGSYNDLSGTPSLATVATTGAYSDLTGKPVLANVAITGSYADLSGTPTVPTTLDSLTDVTITTVGTGDVLKWSGTEWVNGAVAGTGTVTSVNIDTGTTGLTATGGPITSSGNITLGGNLKANYRTTVSSVSYANDATFDWTGQDVLRMTLTGNVGAPTFSGAVDGQKCMLELKQDGVGGRTVTWPANVRFGTDITSITLTSTASKTDRIGFIYNAADSKYDVVAVVKGF